MSDNSNKRSNGDDDYSSITSSELEYILEVNKKSIEIHLENAQQHEMTLKDIADAKHASSDNADELRKLIEERSDELLAYMKEQIKPKIDETDKNTFRLTVILGFVGAATIFQAIQMFFHK